MGSLPGAELWLFAFRLLPITKLRCWMVCGLTGDQRRGDGGEGLSWKDLGGGNEFISQELIETKSTMSVNWQ